MPEINVNQMFKGVRQVVSYMTPVAADGTVIHIAKNVFRFSAVAMVLSAATVLVMSPEQLPAAA